MASDLLWQNSSAPTDGAIGDVNTMRVDPSHLGMAQDVIIDTNGVLRSRGAFKSVTSDTFAYTVVGSAQCSTNTMFVAMERTSNASTVYGSSAAAMTGFARLTACSLGTAGTFAQSLNANIPYVTDIAKFPNDTGAVLCNQSVVPSFANVSSAFVWGGNAVTTSDTTTGTAASTQGSKVIAGVGTAWTSALQGCYLYIGAGAAAVLVGRVATVVSTVAITLEKGAYKTVAAAAPAFKTTRPVMYHIYKGRITTSTTSAVVVGSNTKFLNSGPGSSGGTFITSNAPSLFRYSDGALIGTVTSIQNDSTLTLTGNAAIALTNEEYYLINPTITIDTVPTNYFYGNCVSSWADRYWYGGLAASDTTVKANAVSTQVTPYLAVNNQSSVFFSKKKEPEMLDLDPTAGDIITLPFSSTDSIRGMFATSGGLLVFRSLDTFLITGYSPETFRVIRILDDGITASTAIKPYKNGVVFAGIRSVWYFDGTRIVDLLQNKVRNFYRRTSKPTTFSHPVGTAVTNDHLLVSYDYNSTDATWPYKNTTKTIIICTMVINLTSGAVSFFTNIYVTSSFVPNPVSSTAGIDVVVITRNFAGVNDSAGSTFLLSGNTIFQDSSTAANNFDAVTGAATFTSTVSTQIGPDVMFETTKLTMGDASLLKFWKRFLLNYSSAVGMTATMIGTNDTTIDFPSIGAGTASSDVVAVSSNVGILHRMRFLVRSTTCSIRVYQTNTTSATSQRFKCFWWSVGGKKMRQGRAQP